VCRAGERFKQICAAHPEVRDPSRPRVHVEQTPMVNMQSQTIVVALE
jgi:hypothetical protein